ncbi:3-oxo-tetronate kinase [Pelagibacterium sp.]|uniref:3-oxo-tetronate kinase n=1 Tax=Pelagibacterium sp. TaxID=1967288 RepID=UPI003BA9F14A
MNRQAPFIGAIADDLTGATDLALMLASEGMTVKQVVGVPGGKVDLGGANAVVVALKSRTIPAQDAVAESVNSAKALLAAGARQLFFKYCSTFDSTDKGNIGPVIDALMELSGQDRTLACPAFPTNKRTVYKGHLFVGDELLCDSPMRDHPLTPMQDANLLNILARQTQHAISLVDIETIRGPNLAETLSSLKGIAITDAINDSDLRIIGAAVKDFRLITGGSGLALGLPANFGFTPADRPSPPPAPPGRSVVLAGSCSAATRTQIETALAAGLAGFRLDPIAIAEGRLSLADVRQFASDSSTIPLIYASAAPQEVANTQALLGQERAGKVVEDFLASLASQLVEDGFTRFIVAGGESSGAVIAGLGIKTLSVGKPISPGVPWMHADDGGPPLALALKSGNFGSEDIFVTAWDKLA